ncbi:MAG: hypothetical protein LAQ30_06075 [Acidobacteriia bacterium]|nr:hypothetical protein [Terriglobia bacterium]
MTKRSTADIHSARPGASVIWKIQFAGNSAGMESTWRKPLSTTTEQASGQNSTRKRSALLQPWERMRMAPSIRELFNRTAAAAPR